MSDKLMRLRGLPIGEAFVFKHAAGGKSVGAAVVKLLDANPMRVAVSFTQDGANIMYLSINNEVGALSGWSLDQYQYGKSVHDGEMPGLAGQSWYAIGSATAANVQWIETILVE